MEEIGYKNVFSMICKRIWILIISTVVLTIAAGYVSSFVIKPEYTATVVLLVGKTQGNERAIEYSDILLSQQLANTYGEIIRSRLIASEVIDNLNLRMSTEELINKINIKKKKETELITIEVSDNDPELAAVIANEISTVFIDKTKSIFNTDNVQLIDEASIPNEPSSPRTGIIMLIVCITGIFVCTIAIIIYESMQDTIKSSMEIEENVGISVLGVIPEDKRAKRSYKKQKQIESVFNYDDNSYYCEAYRSFRTNLQFTFINQKIKTIVVTSPGPGEGKSTLVSNLAIKLSSVGYNVLLIDTDLRNPQIHEIFALLNFKGLTNILMGDADVKETINTLSPGYPDILTSGPVPHNPSEMLSSSRMKLLLEQLKGTYDIVLLDSPSLGLVSDAMILSSIADGVIIVYEAEKTKVEIAKCIKTSLNKANINILGAVLNKTSTKSKDYKQLNGKKYFNKPYVQRNKSNYENKAGDTSKEITSKQTAFDNKVDD